MTWVRCAQDDGIIAKYNQQAPPEKRVEAGRQEHFSFFVAELLFSLVLLHWRLCLDLSTKRIPRIQFSDFVQSNC
jgi:hypothetical protein